MQRFRKVLIGSALAATTLTGGALGAALIGGTAGAQDSTTTSTASTQSTAPTTGTQTAPPTGDKAGTPPPGGKAGTPPNGGKAGTPPNGGKAGTPPNGPQGTRPDPSKGGHQANGKTEALLTGTQKTKAEAAAKAAVAGGTVERSETDAEGAAFEVHMTKSDGSHVTVKLDASYKVTSVEDGPA